MIVLHHYLDLPMPTVATTLGIPAGNGEVAAAPRPAPAPGGTRCRRDARPRAWRRDSRHDPRRPVRPDPLDLAPRGSRAPRARPPRGGARADRGDAPATLVVEPRKAASNDDRHHGRTARRATRHPPDRRAHRAARGGHRPCPHRRLAADGSVPLRPGGERSDLRIRWDRPPQLRGGRLGFTPGPEVPRRSSPEHRDGARRHPGRRHHRGRAHGVRPARRPGRRDDRRRAGHRCRGAELDHVGTGRSRSCCCRTDPDQRARSCGRRRPEPATTPGAARGSRRRSGSILNPTYSPDGAWIAFASGEQSGPTRLFIIRPDGTGLRSLDTEAVEASDGGGPAWSPDPAVHRILYETMRDGEPCSGFWTWTRASIKRSAPGSGHRGRPTARGSRSGTTGSR